MTVRVERSFDIDATPEDVWEFIADPTARAKAISVVDSFDVREDTTVWHIRLPIPLIRTTVSVKTRDVERREPTYVKFKGTSSAFTVVGEHEIAQTDGSTRVLNRFVVDGRVPGVEGFFERNFEGEIRNLEQALRRHLDDR
ncbi:MAG: SRPBCC family protein [Halanaeroarchaeum sp.]